MFDHLEPPDDRPFPGLAPVQLATFQLDFEEERPLRPKDGIAWQKLLQDRGHRLPRLAPVKQQTVNLQLRGVGQPSDARVLSERTGWQVFMEDGSSNIALFPTAVNLERYNYPGYAQFRDECAHAIEASAELVDPKVFNRVFLSYANALSDERAENVAFWRDKVQSHFLGPTADNGLSSDFARGFASFTFEDSDTLVELRTGIQPDQVHKGCFAFVFQTEVALRGIRAMEESDPTQILDNLHTVALKVLYAILTPEYVAELRRA